MAEMTHGDRQRLAGILGMLGSNSAGERDNAARLAEQFRRQHHVTWAELMGAPEIPPVSTVQPAPAPTYAQPAPAAPPTPPVIVDSLWNDPDYRRTVALTLFGMVAAVSVMWFAFMPRL